MGDDAQGGDLVKDAAEGLLEGVRVKRCETLVEDTQVSTLEKRPGDVETTPFTMGKLPASLADHLLQSSWHAVEEIPKTERAAKGCGLL